MEKKSRRIFWNLNEEERRFFKLFKKQMNGHVKPLVLWGWKRDKVLGGKRYPESRTVYFSADLDLAKQRLVVKRAYFFLQTRAKDREIETLAGDIGGRKLLSNYPLRAQVEASRKHEGYSVMRMEIGEMSDYDKATVARRLLGRPRLSIGPPKLIEETRNYDIRNYAPLVIYCGSGLSSESGLPLLGSIHQLFAVDDPRTGELVFGDRDPLPARLVEDVDREFKRFCEFSVKAIKAKPSKTHELLAKLYRSGVITQLFSDNLDDILSKVGVPYIQTRLSIFPDRLPVDLDTQVKGMLVVGISVDRREVVKQARRKGMKIIVVNPVMEVAPYSRNMDYLCKGDIFFKGEAKEILPKMIEASGF